MCGVIGAASDGSEPLAQMAAFVFPVRRGAPILNNPEFHHKQLVPYIQFLMFIGDPLKAKVLVETVGVIMIGFSPYHTHDSNLGCTTYEMQIDITCAEVKNCIQYLHWLGYTLRSTTLIRHPGVSTVTKTHQYPVKHGF